MGLFTQQNEQQQTYQEPPKMISTKDFLYIKDMMSWNLLAAKKMKWAAETCQLPDLKKSFQAAEQLHTKHFEELIKTLQQNQGGSVS